MSKIPSREKRERRSMKVSNVALAAGADKLDGGPYDQGLVLALASFTFIFAVRLPQWCCDVVLSETLGPLSTPPLACNRSFLDRDRSNISCRAGTLGPGN